MTTRSTDRRGFLTAAAALSASCARWRDGSAMRTLRVGVTPHLHMSGLYLAEELGYFRESGLALQFSVMPVASQTVPLLVAGEIDAAMMGLSSSFVNAVAKGAMVRIAAGRSYTSPVCGDYASLYGRRKAWESGPADLRRLKGARVGGVRRTAISEFCLEMILNSASLGVGDLQIIDMEDPDAIAAMLAGRVDYILVSNFEKDPASLNPDIVPITNLGRVLPGLGYGFLFFGKRLIEAPPATGEKFVAAYLRGVRGFVGGQTPKFFDETAKSKRMDLKLARDACRDYFHPDGRIDLPGIGMYLDWAIRRKYSSQRVKVEQLVDGRFLQGALRRLETRAGQERRS